MISKCATEICRYALIPTALVLTNDTYRIVWSYWTRTLLNIFLPFLLLIFLNAGVILQDRNPCPRSSPAHYPSPMMMMMMMGRRWRLGRKLKSLSWRRRRRRERDRTRAPSTVSLTTRSPTPASLPSPIPNLLTFRNSEGREGYACDCGSYM